MTRPPDFTAALKSHALRKAAPALADLTPEQLSAARRSRQRRDKRAPWPDEPHSRPRGGFFME